MKRFKLLLLVGLSVIFFVSMGSINSNASSSYKTTDKVYTTQVTNLYQRNGKDKILHLKKNQELKLLKLDDSSTLTKVKSGNQVGYIYNDKMTAVKGMNTNMYDNSYPAEVTKKTYLYSKADQHSKKLKTIPKFDMVNQINPEGDWYLVQYHHQTGYVEKKNLQSMLLSK